MPGMGRRLKPRPRKARKKTGMASEPTILDLARTKRIISRRHRT
jgi:hypothetical protein